MFKVIHTGTDRVFTVYAVSGTRFLVFIDGEIPRWEWREMDGFVPVAQD